MGLEKLRKGWTERACLCPAKIRLHHEGSEASLKGEIRIRFMYKKSHVSNLRKMDRTDEVCNNWKHSFNNSGK